jgi:hypothetical protein
MRVSRAGWVLSGVLALAIGVAAALWRAPRTIDISDLPASPGAAPAAAPKQDPDRPARPAPPALAHEAAPPGVTAAQWAQLRAELAGRPDELRRIASHLHYTDSVRRFRAAEGAERRQLAQALDAGLDERLRQREVSAGEARLLKIAVLDTLMPADAEARQAALAGWQSQWAAAPRADDGARQARENVFQARQAAAVAAWSAQPAAQRDAKALERELEALRRASFPAP